jgi:hypothetical protein
VKTVDGGFVARALLTVTQSSLQIAFVPSSITMYTYSTYKSNLVFRPSTVTHGPVQYVSNAPAVADVDAFGYVTAYAQGTATIQASVSGATALLQVYVLDFLYYATKSTVTPIKPRKYDDYGASKGLTNFRR